MTVEQGGIIAIRAVGLFLIVFGLIAAVDFLVHLSEVRRALANTGWTTYGPLSPPPPASGTVSRLSGILHDSYYVVSPSVSPIGSILFLAFGALFMIFSRRLSGLVLPRNRQPDDG